MTKGNAKLATNEERREVARNIRDADLTKHASYYEEVKGWDHVRATRFVLVSNLGSAIGIDKAIFSIDDLKIRLADLIEPEPERTCKNLYKQRDKKGRIPVDDGVCFVCSECDAYVRDAEGYHSGLYPSYNSDEFHYDIEFSYCPNCGAKVVENEVTPQTKDGTIIKLTDMTESHILNCMRIVGRKDPWHDRFERELRRREFERITNGETFNACYFYPDNESGMGGLRCSHCNELWFPENDVSRFDFCPKCGYERMI